MYFEAVNFSPQSCDYHGRARNLPPRKRPGRMEENPVKKLMLFAVVALVSCNPVENANPYIQRQDLIGIWSASYVTVESCVANGVVLAPDTAVYKSTYWIYPDSIGICIRQIVRSPCGTIPLPVCIPFMQRWTTRHDTLLVYPGDLSGTANDTARYALSRYSTGEIIFSSDKSVDTCSKE